MANGYYIRPEAITGSISAMEKALAHFREATGKARKTADALASMWEGDTRNKFVEKQAERDKMFREMEQAVSDTMAMLKTTSNRYAATDLQCAKKIGR